MRVNTLASAAALAGLSAAQDANNTGIQGFNSGAFKTDYSAKTKSDFEKEMTAAQNLHNSPGLFNSMRIYTNIQHDTDDTPIEAFDAAVETNTTLLLGLWASDVKSVDKEIKALKAGLDNLGEDLANLVVGISVGSEDLYRSSESGIENEAGIGASPKTIVKFIRDTRKALKGTLLEDKPIGHVDTWTAWGNKSNDAVLKELDFLGADVYPYYEYDKGNSFDNLTNVWGYIYGTAEDAAKRAGVPLWITETGYPHSGPTSGDAEASVDNAEAYWQQIGCGQLFGRTNTWWYNLGDSNPDNEEEFGVSPKFDGETAFDLICPNDSEAPQAINTEENAGALLSGGLGVMAALAAGAMSFSML